MNTTEINGIGSDTADQLSKHDFDTIGDIAGANIGELTELDGFGEDRANEVRNEARQLVTEIDDEDGDAEKVWLIAQDQFDYEDDERARERVREALDAVPAPIEAVAVTEVGMYGGDYIRQVCDDDAIQQFTAPWDDVDSREAIDKRNEAMAEWVDRAVVIETGDYLGMTLNTVLSAEEIELSWHVVDME